MRPINVQRRCRRRGDVDSIRTAGSGREGLWNTDGLAWYREGIKREVRGSSLYLSRITSPDPEPFCIDYASSFGMDWLHGIGGCRICAPEIEVGTYTGRHIEVLKGVLGFSTVAAVPAGLGPEQLRRDVAHLVMHDWQRRKEEWWARAGKAYQNAGAAASRMLLRCSHVRRFRNGESRRALLEGNAAFFAEAYASLGMAGGNEGTGYARERHILERLRADPEEIKAFVNEFKKLDRGRRRIKREGLDILFEAAATAAWNSASPRGPANVEQLAALRDVPLRRVPGMLAVVGFAVRGFNTEEALRGNLTSPGVQRDEIMASLVRKDSLSIEGALRAVMALGAP